MDISRTHRRMAISHIAHGCAAAIVSAILLSSSAKAEVKDAAWQNPNVGDWNVPGNWNLNLNEFPNNNANTTYKVTVGQGTAKVNGTYTIDELHVPGAGAILQDLAGSTLTAGSIELESAQAGGALYDLRQGTLHAQNFFWIGRRGLADLKIGAATFTSDDLAVLVGGVTIAQGATVNLKKFRIGVLDAVAGTGQVQQTGGNVTIIGDIPAFVLGAGNVGKYTLSGGTLSVTGRALIQNEVNRSEFLQSGGTHSLTGSVDVGGTAIGYYELSGGSFQVTGEENVGREVRSEGTFKQTGGAHSVTGAIAIGCYSTIIDQQRVEAIGKYTMEGGTLNAGAIWIGGTVDPNPNVNGGFGVFEHKGGAIQAGSVILAPSSLGEAHYTMSGDWQTTTLSVGSLTVGAKGGVEFTQTGGGVNVTNELHVVNGDYTMGAAPGQSPRLVASTVTIEQAPGAFWQKAGSAWIDRLVTHGNGQYFVNGDCDLWVNKLEGDPGWDGSGLTNWRGRVHLIGDWFKFMKVSNLDQGVFSIEQAAKSLNGATLVNQGTTNVLGSAALTFSNNARIDNTGLIDLQSDARLAGTGTINNNNGTVRKSAGSESVIELACNFNGGAIDVQTGSITTRGNLSISSANKTGAGTLNIWGQQNHPQYASLAVVGGTLVLNTDAGPNYAHNLNLSVYSNATLNTTQHLDDLNLVYNSGARVSVAPSGRNVLTLSDLHIYGTTLLNMNDNDMVVHAMLADVVIGYLHSAQTEGWGMTFTPSGNMGLGAAFNNDGYDNPLVGSFAGESVGLNDTLVKYTYVGDVNLDGVVNQADYALFNQGIGWCDFNYDGAIDDADRAMLQNSLSLGLGAFTWSGGNCPTAHVVSGATMNVSGAGAKSLSGLFTNAGTFTCSGSGNIQAAGGTAITNSGQWTLQTDASITWDGTGATPTFYNSGTLSKTGGTGVSAIAGNFVNAGGTVDVQTGTIVLTGAVSIPRFSAMTKTGQGSLQMSGSFTPSDATLDVQSGTVAVSGTFNLPSNTTLTKTGTGPLNISGALLASGGTLDVEGGTVALIGGFTASASNSFIKAGGQPLTISGGFLSDNGTMDVRAGEVAITGNCTVPAARTLTKIGDGALTISGPQSHGDGAALIASAGTVNLNSDAGSEAVANLSLTVNSSTTANLNVAQHLDNLTNAGGTITSPAVTLRRSLTQSNGTTNITDLTGKDFTVSGGTLSTSYTKISGAATHSAGSHSVSNTLVLGSGSGSAASYTLSGSASLSTYSTQVGSAAAGTFTHNAGTHTVNSLSVGTMASGQYNLNGGSLSATTITLGGAGTFN